MCEIQVEYFLCLFLSCSNSNFTIMCVCVGGKRFVYDIDLISVVL